MAQGTCSTEGCEKPLDARGLCHSCYTRSRNNGLEKIQFHVLPRPAAERFWAKVNKDGPLPELAPHLGPCWIWTASLRTSGYGAGYGQFFERTGPVSAYVWSWTDKNGQVPEGLELDHLCRVRACVNPDHLEPVTHAENMRRRPPSGRTHCRQGHLLNDTNIYTNSVTGERSCRTCSLARMKRYQKRKREQSS